MVWKITQPYEKLMDYKKMLKKEVDKKLVLLKEKLKNNKTASWFFKIELPTKPKTTYKINIHQSACKNWG